MPEDFYSTINNQQLNFSVTRRLRGRCFTCLSCDSKSTFPARWATRPGARFTSLIRYRAPIWSAVRQRRTLQSSAGRSACEGRVDRRRNPAADPASGAICHVALSGAGARAGCRYRVSLYRMSPERFAELQNSLLRTVNQASLSNVIRNEWERVSEQPSPSRSLS